MTLSSTINAALHIPRPPLWGIGYYPLGDELGEFPVGWNDIERDWVWAQALLADHGLERGNHVMVTSLANEAPWHAPIEMALRALGVPYSPTERMAADAFHIGLFTRHHDMKFLLAVDAAVVTTLAQRNELDVLRRIPKIFAFPDAHPLLLDAGLSPFIFTPLGPATAFECHHRNGAHVNADEWALSSDADGQLLITTVGNRAYKVRSSPMGVRTLLRTDPCPCGRTGPRVLFGHK